jgi:hypothetical protein
MIFHVILAALGLMMVWWLLATIFWVCAWLLIQPVRLVLRLLVAIQRLLTTPAAPPPPSNVIPFRRRA